MKYKISILLSILNFAFVFSQEKTTTLEPVIIKGRKKNTKERHEFKRHAQSTEVLNDYELNRNNPAWTC